MAGGTFRRLGITGLASLAMWASFYLGTLKSKHEAPQPIPVVQTQEQQPQEVQQPQPEEQTPMDLYNDGVSKFSSSFDFSSLENVIFSSEAHNFRYQQATIAHMEYDENDDSCGMQHAGQGVFITSDGFFLTNYHVVAHMSDRCATEYNMAMAQNRTSIALEFAAELRNSDLALLKVKDTEQDMSRFNDLHCGDVSLSYAGDGFTHVYFAPGSHAWFGPELNRDDIRLSEAPIDFTWRSNGEFRITGSGRPYWSVALIADDYETIVGMSGSPIYDSSGNLGGILSSQESDSSKFVPADVIFSFLRDCVCYQKLLDDQ